jgi:FKBP-type peptidyl-prolyl cis-trans isomerase FkpA
MKLKLPLIAAFVAALGISAALTACGGGSGSYASSNATAVSSPATLTRTDTVVGTGATAAAGNTVTVNYTGWLYNASAADFKGTQFDTSIGKTPFQFTLGANAVVPGFDQGVTGMKVGGKRVVLIPSALGYGAGGSGSTIPPNSGLVFEIELLTVK